MTHSARDRRFEATAPQREAINAPLGPVLVLAGPGAGKTYCLIERIRVLVEQHGLAPSRICALTFTNRAAEEIAGRLGSALGSRAEEVTRCTIHALCVALLREHGAHVGLPPGFGIADEDYQRELLRRLGVPERRRQWLLTQFGRYRLDGLELTADDLALFQRYRAVLDRRKLLDFDDLVACTDQLLAQHEDIATTIAGRWDYVLIDEFQDLTPAQYRIVRRLARDHRNIFVVGDDEQSIYSWAGADPRLLRDLLNDFRIIQPIVLDENRRCSRQIFETARRLLEAQPALFIKELRAERESPYPVSTIGFADEQEEVAWLLADLARDREESALAWGDIGILYRKNDTGAALEAALVAEGIPCRLAAGRALQDDPVVQYLIAALRVAGAPGDRILADALARVVLPKSLYQRVIAEAESLSIDPLVLMHRMARRAQRGDEDRRKINRFLYLLQNLPALAARHEQLAGLVDELLSQRVGEFRTVLEERHEDLTDPAEYPEVVSMGAQLASAIHGRKRVWLPRLNGLEIALAGMLGAAGVTTIQWLVSGAQPSPDDIVLDLDSLGELGPALGVFKALQLVHASALNDVFRDFVTVDLETTDKDIRTCEIVEIAAVRVRDGAVVDRFRTLVRPRQEMTEGARRIHGYSDAELHEAPWFEEVWPHFRAFIANDVLVAHNGHGFDFPILRRMSRELAGGGHFAVFDTLPLARDLHPGSRRLEDLAREFGVETGRSHHALDDTLTLAQVFLRLEQEKLARARKTALASLLDWLGLALVLNPEDSLPGEALALQPITNAFALRRYSNCLERYNAERALPGAEQALPLDEVIERLGGWQRWREVRAERSAHDRYPAAMARLRRILQAVQGSTLKEQLQSFLERIALSRSDGAETDQDRVNLLTLHATKGLEFSRVYIVGVEDGQLPGTPPLREITEEEIAEARRLLYVGMTRAKDRLVLTRVEARGGRSGGGQRFVDEMGLVVSSLDEFVGSLHMERTPTE